MSQKEIIVLGIETSCDDTSLCILKKREQELDVLSQVHFTQEEILSKWGGVVPELAARNHLDKITPLLDQCFRQASMTLQQIDVLAVTIYPGLLGPLLTGLNAAKTLSLLTQKPIVPVNHLYAHLEAIHLTEKIQYPYLGLLVSGGHSAFFKVTGPNQFEILGSTNDDAAGEAFDKGGKMMGLGYPAGKIINQWATKGNAKAIKFPIGMANDQSPNMSFSGLKTALRVHLEKNPDATHEQNLPDLCASYQEAIVSALALKTHKAYQVLSQKLPLVVGGGVACNSRLREVLTKEFKDVHFVAPQYCIDNGTMIANWAARNLDQQIPYPQCLLVDARNRFIDKKDYI